MGRGVVARVSWDGLWKSCGVGARFSREIDSERRPRGRMPGGLEVFGLGKREKLPGAGEDIISVLVSPFCLSMASMNRNKQGIN